MDISRQYRAELKLYRFLGIPRFRKLLMAWARLRHRRRGGRNPRYHLQTLSLSGAEGFLKESRRFTRLHVTSLVFLVLAWLGLVVLGESPLWMHLLTALLLWLNLGCLLLQRQHYVRVQLLREKNRSREK